MNFLQVSGLVTSPVRLARLQNSVLARDERDGLVVATPRSEGAMAQRVNLDAMIRREDLARQIEGSAPPDLIRELNLSNLEKDAGLRRLLRKPDFQRETNHWTPDQVVKFLASFIDGHVIPSVILWRSTNFVFVIDGGHRLSALCAWMANDYGDKTESLNFYQGQISKEQRRAAERTRKMVDASVGSFESLRALVGTREIGPQAQRASAMYTRPIVVQTVNGGLDIAEASFYAINTQGTPLDDTEEFLIRNRKAPVAIGARAIIRAGTGHTYWSAFSAANQKRVIDLASKLHETIFQPELETPIKSINLPIAGSAAPIDAMSVLVDFLGVDDPLAVLDTDETGDDTIKILKKGLRIVSRMTGNSPESLGLHPAVYFSNEKGKHSRFLFLGMAALIADKLKNNDDLWFRKFTDARKLVEKFLIDHKSMIGILLQNLGRAQRVPKMQQMFDYLTEVGARGEEIDPPGLLEELGVRGRVYELTAVRSGSRFSDDSKSEILYRARMENAQLCPLCGGLLDIDKSVSYDHIKPVRDGGTGEPDNGRLVHPYCNSIRG